MTDTTGDATTPLPALIDRAADALNSARSSAEVLEARDHARFAYDAAKSAGRIAKAKKAHEDVISAVYRAQADALLIEARAKIRLADEYDAAQERGEVAKVGNPSIVGGDNNWATTEDLGIRRDEIHEARKLRDAEKSEPGKAERVLTDLVDRGEEPTKAKLKGALLEPKPKKPSGDTSVDHDDPRDDEIEALQAENSALRSENDALKSQIAELSASNQGAVISKLREQKNAADLKRKDALDGERRMKFRLKKETERADAAEKRVRQLEGEGVAL